MGDGDITRRVLGPLPERAQIKAEAFAHAALGVFDFGVHLAGGQIDKLRRHIGDDCLEAQALFKLRARADGWRRHRMIPVMIGE